MNLIWFEQESETSCVPACVRMVLSSFGENWSEIEIIKMFGNPRLGITLAKAHTKLSEFGADAKLDIDLNTDDLRDFTRQNIFPIVGVERHIFGYLPASHAVVVSKVTSTHIECFDPFEKEYPKTFEFESFELAWKLTGKEALLIYSGPKK